MIEYDVKYAQIYSEEYEDLVGFGWEPFAAFWHPEFNDVVVCFRTTVTC